MKSKLTILLFLFNIFTVNIALSAETKKQKSNFRANFRF